MISADMRNYNYYTIGERDEYGQEVTSADIKGQVKMAIYTMSQAIQPNIKYSNANYIGLTTDQVNDAYVIQYENEKLKVLYVNPKGRYKQVFMVSI